MIARTIQLILAPVVMVSACAILATGILSHYAAINDRLRAIGRERLDLLRGKDAEADRNTRYLLNERLDEIDYQIPELLHRHKLTRDAVLAVYSAVLVFITDMFAIAVAAVTGADWASTLALIVFLAGISALLTATWFAVIEVRHSHETVQYETRRIASLGKVES